MSWLVFRLRADRSESNGGISIFLFKELIVSFSLNSFKRCVETLPIFVIFELKCIISLKTNPINPNRWPDPMIWSIGKCSLPNWGAECRFTLILILLLNLLDRLESGIKMHFDGLLLHPPDKWVYSFVVVVDEGRPGFSEIPMNILLILLGLFVDGVLFSCFFLDNKCVIHGGGYKYINLYGFISFCQRFSLSNQLLKPKNREITLISEFLMKIFGSLCWVLDFCPDPMQVNFHNLVYLIFLHS